ncbi:hypothetical protein RJ639_012733, partial [Escallonia herrerae]
MHQAKLKTMLSTTLRSAFCSPLPPHKYKLTNPLSSSPSSSLQHPQWPGLQNWRRNQLNQKRFWGPNGPTETSIESNDDDDDDACAVALMGSRSLAEMGALVLSTPDPLTKSKLSHMAFSRNKNYRFEIAQTRSLNSFLEERKENEGREHVSPKEIPDPKKSALPLNAFMLHNLANVELNAIDLAWDTVVRFSPHSELLGEGFYDDFAHVADDESRHFAWCSQRLAELGFSYGDIPAHNMLWRECEKSSDNVAARLALIPLVQ